MGRASGVIRLAGLALAAALGQGAGACSDRAQLVVVIDTDMALPSHVAADPTVLPAASFSRVRVELLGSDEKEVLVRGDRRQDFVLTETSDWPLTFGIAEGDSGTRVVRLRVRAYLSDSVYQFSKTYDVPDERLTVDRLVTVEVPESGKQLVHVVLRGECLGIPADLESDRSCVDGPGDVRSSRDAASIVDAAPPSVAATWRLARSRPCTLAPPDAGAVCVPGGLSIRGDAAFYLVDTLAGFVSSFPRHLVEVSPFYLDARETTVGRFRALLAAGKLPGVVLPEPDRQLKRCTWTPTPDAAEDLPLTCVEPATARAVCAALGGDLPTDAQWEHAARSGGRASPYVWGDLAPECCASRIADQLGCPAARRAVAGGSYADPSRCGGRADRTRDGVLDLAGNVRELVRDTGAFYGSEECPLDAITRDPLCASRPDETTARGGSFRSTFDQAKIGVRRRAANADDLGFRCAYRGAGP